MHIFLHQDYEQVDFSVTGKSQLFYISLKIGTFQPKFDKTHVVQHSQLLCDAMQEDIDNLEFVQCVDFEFIVLLRSNGTKYLPIFDGSPEEISNSKAYVGIATAERQLGLSTICLKDNLFHENKLGREVELQNSHIVLLESPHDVMQVSTFIAHLGLGSEFVDWYPDAAWVPDGHLLIDLLPRTVNRVR